MSKDLEPFSGFGSFLFFEATELGSQGTEFGISSGFGLSETEEERAATPSSKVVKIASLIVHPEISPRVRIVPRSVIRL